MKTSAPTKIVLIISLVLALLGLLGFLGVLAPVAAHSFWLIFSAYLVLLVGNLMTGV